MIPSCGIHAKSHLQLVSSNNGTDSMSGSIEGKSTCLSPCSEDFIPSLDSQLHGHTRDNGHVLATKVSRKERARH